MRLVVTRELLRRILRWTQRGLLACALSLLGYCAYVLADTWYFQKSQHIELEGLLAGSLPSAVSTPNLPPTAAVGLIGRIAVPRLGLSVIVMEGTGETTLRHAAGHISGTALPGQVGNVGIAGHRDTFFRPLRHIRANDLVTLTTLFGEHRYRVVSTRIVSPSDVSVLDTDASEILTLVTCYPFYFVGAAPDRFIVRAKSVE